MNYTKIGVKEKMGFNRPRMSCMAFYFKPYNFIAKTLEGHTIHSGTHEVYNYD